jgi:hypothetical protein
MPLPTLKMGSHSNHQMSQLFHRWLDTWPDSREQLLEPSVVASNRFAFKLPPEIQLLVWKESLPRPRLVEVQLQSTKSHVFTTNPTLLYINQHCRNLVRKQYKPLFKRTSDPIAYFNANIDICFVHLPILEDSIHKDYDVMALSLRYLLEIVNKPISVAINGAFAPETEKQIVNQYWGCSLRRLSLWIIVVTIAAVTGLSKISTILTKSNSGRSLNHYGLLEGGQERTAEKFLDCDGRR